MPAPLEIDDPSPFESALRWLGRPGYAARSALRGNTFGAARQIGDFLGDVVDAPLPGDWVPSFSQKEDYPEASDLVGGMEPGWGKFGVDVVGGIATDPLSYLSFGATGGIRAGIPLMPTKSIKLLDTAQPVDPLSLIGRGADAAIRGGLRQVDNLRDTSMRPAASSVGTTGPSLESRYDTTLANVRDTLGWQKLTPEQTASVGRIRGTGGTARKAAAAEAARISAGLTDDEARALGDAFDAIDWDNRQVIGGAPLDQRVDALATARGLDAAKLKAKAAEIQGLHQRWWDEERQFGGFAPQTQAVPEYLARKWNLPEKEAERLGILDEVSPSSRTDPQRQRTLRTPQEVINLVQQLEAAGQPVGKAFERDVRRRLIDRASDHGTIVERGLAGRTALAASPAATVGDAIKDLANNRDDYARTLQTLWTGMPERGFLTGALAQANKYFKPAAVYGFLLPRISGIARNAVGMPIQAASQGGLTAAMQAAKPALGGFFTAADDMFMHAFGSARLAGDDLTKAVDAVEAAIKASGGTARGTRQQLAKRPELQDALYHGVLDGFVDSETLIREAVAKPSTFWRFAEAPGKWFQGVEQRGRLGLFMAKREEYLGQGMTRSDAAAAAAKFVKDSFLDYSVSSKYNRMLRDLVPFAQFTAQTIPQQAQWMSRQPAAAVAMGQFFGQDDESLVYPYMQGKATMPIGEDTEGNPQYLTGLGLPAEALSTIPGSAPQFMRGIVAQSHPLAKSALAWATGEDPYFGTPFGSYAKTPALAQALGAPEESEAARWYNVAKGTGLIQPLASVESTLSTVLDPNKPWWEPIAPGRVVSVDEDRAMQAVMRNYLAQNPDVNQYTSFYSGDPEAKDLLAQYQEIRKRIKQKGAQQTAP